MIKDFMTEQTIENIYGIATGPEDDPKFVYVGKTKIGIEKYWKYTHCKNYETVRKTLYEHIRRNGGIDQYRIVLLDTTENGLTENDYVKTLTLAGHTLYNDNSGNSKVQAKPSKIKTLFNTLNRQADERLDANERRVRLHNSAQQLSKSELTRQRITGAFPTLEELSAATWHECPGELLGVQKGRSVERAEYTKLGDISIFIGYRKKDRETCSVIRRRDNTELNIDGTWSRAPKERLLAHFAEFGNSDMAWWRKVYH